jgi:hypothetical protein
MDVFKRRIKMKKILAALLIGMFTLSGIALAITVSTNDGQNFTVTNDAGVTTTWTNAQMVQGQKQYQSSMANDNSQITRFQQKYQQDSEGVALMTSMISQANTTSAAYQAEQLAAQQAAVYAVNTNTVNWYNIAQLEANGVNWTDIKSTYSGVNWSSIPALQGINLQGINWSGVNWSNFGSSGETITQFLNSAT